MIEKFRAEEDDGPEGEGKAGAGGDSDDFAEPGGCQQFVEGAIDPTLDRAGGEDRMRMVAAHGEILDESEIHRGSRLSPGEQGARPAPGPANQADPASPKITRSGRWRPMVVLPSRVLRSMSRVRRYST